MKHTFRLMLACSVLALACATLAGPTPGAPTVASPPAPAAAGPTWTAIAAGMLPAAPSATPVVVAGPTQTAEPFLVTPQPSITPAPVDLPGNYTVQSGDMVAALAVRFQTDMDSIIARNPGLVVAQTLPPGLRLDMPTNGISPNALSIHLLPDSEAVFSPAAELFDVKGFVLSRPGFLAGYTEVLTGTEPARPGWEIVELYARRFSINPRLVLALLEYQSRALSNPTTDVVSREHPLRVIAPGLLPGLSHQLGWAGNQLNYGYYAWRQGVPPRVQLADGAVRPLDPRINAGTFTVARLLGLLYDREGFERAVSPDGLMATYRALFGDPGLYAIEPLIPGGLAQPPMQLPFEPGRRWAFTSGPHPAYARTLPFAALDFAPPSEYSGCVASPEWLVAVAGGVVSYSGDGRVELDLGGGWSVVYLHTATQDRIPAGTIVRAGDRLAHPGCEGGPATSVHVHLSRRFNGEWIPAGGFAPFEMSGWVARTGASAYQGTLVKGERIVEACPCAIASTRIWIEP